MKQTKKELDSYMRLVVKNVFRMYSNGYNGDTHLPVLTMFSACRFAKMITPEQESYLLRNYDRYTDKAINETYGNGKWRLKDKLTRHGVDQSALYK